LAYQAVILFAVLCFFFQAEDGIRDRNVTGVQTCALPISPFILGIHYAKRWPSISYAFGLFDKSELVGVVTYGAPPSRHLQVGCRSEERRVGKECGCRWSGDHEIESVGGTRGA